MTLVTDNHNSFYCGTFLSNKRFTLTWVKFRRHNKPIFSVMSSGCGFGRLSWQRRRFWGLRSRCTIPLSLSAFSAAATHHHHHHVMLHHGNKDHTHTQWLDGQFSDDPGRQFGVTVAALGTSVIRRVQLILSISILLLHGQITSLYNQPPWQTQPPTLSGTGNEYRLNNNDAVWPWSKDRHGSFHL